jgi:AAA15 family ATPase/GTPase
MLLDFSVENYRSFRDRQTFTMIPDDGKNEIFSNSRKINNKYTVLTTGVIYGANASGKSNLIRAIDAMHKLILNYSDRSPDKNFKEYDPFAFNARTSQAPVVFGINFLIKGIRYSYEFSLLANKVLEEKLSFYPEGRESKLFKRIGQEYDFGDYLKGQKVIVSKLTNENQLFLAKAALNNIPQLRAVYSFFSRNLKTLSASEFSKRKNIFSKEKEKDYTNEIASTLLKAGLDDPFTKQFKALLNSFDTGIEDIEIEGDPEEMLPFDDHEITVKHSLYNDSQVKTGSVDRAFKEESTGTQKLFAMGGLILQGLMNGQTVIIDEFEQSLHPLISSYLLQLFHNPEINTKGAQLIVATHDTNLLSQSDLRRDQIWIVEKDKTGASELFSLADVSGIPKGAPYEKWYLSGRLGGIPSIKSLDFELSYSTDE